MRYNIRGTLRWGLMAAVLLIGCGDDSNVTSEPAASPISNSTVGSSIPATVATPPAPASTIRPPTQSPTTDSVATETSSTPSPSPPPTQPPSTPVDGTPPETVFPPSFVATDPDGSWVLASYPIGFEPVLASSREGRREILYQGIDAPGDLFDSPIVVRVTDPGVYSGISDRGATAVDVNGHTATAYEMHNDGRFYGRAVTWQDDLGRTVTVEWAALDRDVVALARTAVAVDGTQWSLLLRTLSIDTRVGVANGDSVEVVLIDESVGADAYRFVALVPSDYPLTDPDQRRTCYRLDLNGIPGDARCDDHPWWTRTAEHAFVFGPAADGVNEIIVQRADLDLESKADPPVHTTAMIAGGGPPGGLYVAVVPADWCFVTIGAADGRPDPNLGPIGPLPSHPDHAACLSAG